MECTLRSLLDRARVNARLAGALLLVCLAPALQGNLGRFSNFNERVLAAHNREREALGIAPLRWDPRLAAAASHWAAQLTSIGYLVHSEDDPYNDDPEGENLWAGTAGYYSPESMVGLGVALGYLMDLVGGTPRGLRALGMVLGIGLGLLLLLFAFGLFLHLGRMIVTRLADLLFPLGVPLATPLSSLAGTFVWVVRLVEIPAFFGLFALLIASLYLLARLKRRVVR